MACDATARLYDVDEDSVVFEKLKKTERYDQGTITFRARQGRLVDLDKLHESIWATRLSGGTRSGLVSLEVTAVGRVVSSEGQSMLRVAGSEEEFLLSPHPDSDALPALLDSAGDTRAKVTGRIDEYQGRWPSVLAKKPEKPRRILVTDVESSEESPLDAASR